MKNLVTKYDNDDFFGGSWLKNFFDLPIVSNSSVLKTNIKQVGDNYVYEIDIPGFEKENVSVNYENGYLIVEAKNTKENSSKNDSYIRQERYIGSCSRSYYVGDLDESQISAKYTNGVLCITFPIEEKKDKNKIKSINIQ